MKRAKRYDVGGATDDTTEDTTSDTSPASTAEPTPASTASPSPTSFGAAFKAARASGDKTFTYNGKLYTTELASAKKSPTPAGSSAAPSRVLMPNRGGQPGGSVRPRGAGTVMEQGRGVDLYGGSIEGMKNALQGTRRGGGSYAKGGVTKKMASGGSTSSASSRADGIASRGKTRGKFC